MPISRRAVKAKPNSRSRSLRLNQFYEKRTKVLVNRQVGGLGDIFMHRMMFEDIKDLIPLAEIHFACPKAYHEAVQDHPFVTKVLDSETVDISDYMVHYNTTTACGRYEESIAPRSDLHRSDIWAKQCGLNLKKHNMHLRLTEEEKHWGKTRIAKERTKDAPTVCLCPTSSMAQKDMTPENMQAVADGLLERGYNVVALHTNPIKPLVNKGIPCIHKVRIREWMSILYAADYVISVDTAAFHCAGGFGTPMVGLFTWTNGSVYGKYYENTELVQGLCPVGHQGCYVWSACPCKKEALVPCCVNVNSQKNHTLEAFDRLVSRFPATR